MRDVNAKLRWATSRHDEMLHRFADFAKPGGGDDRPYAWIFVRPGGRPVS
jgi:hypothetical protein